MNEQEINKKLAEWRFGEDNLDYNPLGAIGEKVWAWVKWEGKGQPPITVIDGRVSVPVDFPNDLNSCFKWLVPKAVAQITFTLPKDKGVPEAYRILFGQWLNHYLWQDGDVELPLALCLTIGKLIDKEAK